MNKPMLLLLLLLSSCHGFQKPEVQQAIITDNSKKSVKASGDTIPVDLERSTIQWKGTKMRGMGKHEGIVQLQSAYFLTDGERIKRGGFTVDMNSIRVTGIPAHEPVPRRRLNDHLKSVDFFNAKAHPTSHFIITHVDWISGDSLHIHGNLRIKGISRNIRFMATHINKQFSTSFLINRFAWNIAYQGRWIDKTFVDKEIELKINILTK